MPKNDVKLSSLDELAKFMGKQITIRNGNRKITLDAVYPNKVSECHFFAINDATNHKFKINLRIDSYNPCCINVLMTRQGIKKSNGDDETFTYLIDILNGEFCTKCGGEIVVDRERFLTTCDHITGTLWGAYIIAGYEYYH